MSRLGGVIVGLVAAVAVSVFASPGMGGSSPGSFTGSYTGDMSASGDVTAGDDLIATDAIRLATGKKLILNSTTDTSHLQDAAGVMTLTAPASGSFSFVVNATEVANLSSAGALQLDSGITVSGGNVSISTGYLQTLGASLYARSTEYGHVYLLQNTYGGAVYGYNMVANPNDGATAFLVNTQITGTDNPLTSGNIMKFQNDDVDQATIDFGGRIQINMAGNAEPTCNSGARGMLSITQSGAGVGDIVRACLKGTADTYAWRSVYTAP